MFLTLNQCRLMTFGFLLYSLSVQRFLYHRQRFLCFCEEQKVRVESTRNVLPVYVCDTGSELCNLVDVLCFD